MSDRPDERLRINHEVRIPRSELQFRFARSGGPGGQHVNKTETQVELLFDVQNSPSLSAAQRGRILEKLANAIDRAGILHVVSSSTRSQLQNREDAIARFQALLGRALHLPRVRRATAPTIASREQRLAAKRRRGGIKRSRRESPTSDE